jgi:RHS repeat-associated protein
LGSVAALCDVNSVPVERYAYDVFGRPTIRNAAGAEIEESAFGNPYLFTGRAYDVETALYYYRARYYDYYTGRFLQPDPIGYGDGLNLYAYVDGNPCSFVDPLGLCKDVFSKEERAQRNKAVADNMKWYYRQADDDYREFGSCVLRNLETGELFPCELYAPGNIRFVLPQDVIESAVREFIDTFGHGGFAIEIYTHRHGCPDGYMIPGVGPADTNKFSPGDQGLAQNFPGGSIEIYLVNPDGDMRFYSPAIHGPADDRKSNPGSGAGNVRDYVPDEWH